MKITVKSINPLKKYGTDEQDKDQYGNLKWRLLIQDEGNQTYNVNKAFKTGNEPKPEDVLQGSVSEETGQYGTYYKLTLDRPAGSFSGPNKGFSRNDPEVQKAIIRQNALTNAVNYSIAKFERKDLNIKEVLQIANLFSKFSDGEIQPEIPKVADEIEVGE
jgi:hypothetical protein